jgi:hypothetical protein
MTHGWLFSYFVILLCSRNINSILTSVSRIGEARTGCHRDIQIASRNRAERIHTQDSHLREVVSVHDKITRCAADRGLLAPKNHTG